ncbi:LysR family transcriptional regulator [Streptosporangiaceae bacterium NEAU-GS5]|nr:LysR family transcriptional regulator [Streptosporangiaceae bacterium NEAU-GS5]
MELRQLQYMVAVAEEGGFTRAAARVRVAQPAISQQIAQLERELGEKLFDRSDRRVRLTAAGEAFLPYARAVLGAAEQGRAVVRSLTGVLTGRLDVAAVQAPPPVLARRLAGFQRRYPHVRITLRIGHPEELTEAVAGGVVDVAVLALAGQRLPAVLETRELHVEALVIAAPPGHPLATEAEATLDVLEAYPVVTMTTDGGLRAALEEACARAGVRPRIAAETDDVMLVADLVGQGDWVALLPRSVAERARRPLVVLPLKEPALTRETVLAWHRSNLSAPGRAFVEYDDHA